MKLNILARTTTRAILLVILGSGSLAPIHLSAQSNASEGTEFFVAFQKNYLDYVRDHKSNKLTPTQPLSLQLILTSRRAASVSIEWPGHSQVVTLLPDVRTVVDVDSMLQLRSFEEVDHRTVHLKSDHAITVTALTHRYQTTDSYTIFPVECLGTRYRAVGYRWLADDLLSQIAVVATEDDTRVEILPTTETSTGKGTYQSFTVTLNRGEAYQVRPKFRVSEPSDLTGSLVTSSRPIALFSGHNCAYVPDISFKACNVLSEQLRPIEVWGRRFVAAPLYPRKQFTVRIIPDEPGTSVRLNGEDPIEITGPWIEKSISNEPLLIEADKRVQVAQYAHGYTAPIRRNGVGDSIGDPMMILLPPVENYGNSYRAIGPFSNDFVNYVSIVCGSEGRRSVYVGGELVNPEMFRQVGESDLWYAAIEIIGGMQTISSQYSISVVSYGFGYGPRVFDAYGHVAPMWETESSLSDPVESVERETSEEITTSDPESESPIHGGTWRPVERIE